MWSEKVEDILESRNYETLTVDELFSKLKTVGCEQGSRTRLTLIV
jgi:hypothetical protein